jgi:hypothetical protein
MLLAVELYWSTLMERYIVEVLDRDPNLQQVIVPIYETIVDRPDSALESTLDQALFIYATGDTAPLERLLQESGSACEFIADLNEDWFVRAETTFDSRCEARTRSICSAVAVAHALLSRTAARAVLDEC